MVEKYKKNWENAITFFKKAISQNWLIIQSWLWAQIMPNIAINMGFYSETNRFGQKPIDLAASVKYDFAKKLGKLLCMP